VPLGGDTGVVALLATDDGAASRPIPDRTVIFIGERAGGGRFGASAKTGLDGQAVLVPASWPAGSYTVQAYFGQDALTLPDGTVAGFTDAFYGPSASEAQALTLSGAANTPPALALLAASGFCAAGNIAQGGFTVRLSDAETPAASLALSVSSSNPAVSATVSGSGAERVVTVTVSGSAKQAGTLTLSVSDGALSGLALSVRVTKGTSGGEQLSGGSGTDLIFGLGGDDKLRGSSGADILCGGDGKDQLDGGEEDDVLAGEAGDDQLKGGRGDDLLDGGAGNDQLLGDQGADTLTGGPGADMLNGGPDADTATDYTPSQGDKRVNIP
jgi:Ca2+-binding RTX toxin-like protein